jgi:hypothetical protein
MTLASSNVVMKMLAMAMCLLLPLAAVGVHARFNPVSMMATQLQAESDDAINFGKIPFQFALKFKCISENGVNHATAESQTLVTEVRDNAVPSFSIFEDTEDGFVAKWTSVLVNQTATSWSEKGNITFGKKSKMFATATVPDSILFFESPGMTGVIFGPNFGAIQYNITGGTGRFHGARGMMIDTFFVPPNATAFDINAWGFFWLAV